MPPSTPPARFVCAPVAALVVEEDLVVDLRAAQVRVLEAVADLDAPSWPGCRAPRRPGGASRRRRGSVCEPRPGGRAEDAHLDQARRACRGRPARRRWPRPCAPSSRGRSSPPRSRARGRRRPRRRRPDGAATSPMRTTCPRTRMPSAPSSALASAPAATRAHVSRAEARSSTLRTSSRSYLSAPARSAWPGRGRTTLRLARGDLGELLVAGRPGAHRGAPARVVAVADDQRDRPAQRAAVAQAAEDLGLVAARSAGAGCARSRPGGGQVARGSPRGRPRGPPAGRSTTAVMPGPWDSPAVTRVRSTRGRAYQRPLPRNSAWLRPAGEQVRQPPLVQLADARDARGRQGAPARRLVPARHRDAAAQEPAARMLDLELERLAGDVAAGAAERDAADCDVAAPRSASRPARPRRPSARCRRSRRACAAPCARPPRSRPCRRGRPRGRRRGPPRRTPPSGRVRQARLPSHVRACSARPALSAPRRARAVSTPFGGRRRDAQVDERVAVRGNEHRPGSNRCSGAVSEPPAVSSRSRMSTSASAAARGT